MNKILAPTKKAKRAMKKYGITYDDSMNSYVSFMERVTIFVLVILGAISVGLFLYHSL